MGCLMVSCDKDNDNESGGKTVDTNLNWWYRANLAPIQGVKSVSDENFTANFDRNGRLIYQKYSNYGETSETTYEYNSDNLVTKETYKSVDSEGQKHESVTTYEYKNKGKFVPMQFFHLYDTGLVPDLSKVTEVSNGVTSTVTYTFGSDGNLTMTLDYGDGDSDTYTVEFKGAYPYHMEIVYENNVSDFIGPITYQSNGMFDCYTEGFNYEDGSKSTRKYYFRKDFNNAMLMEKYDLDQSWSHDVTTYEYDAKGNMVKETEVIENFTEGETYTYIWTYKYEFDSKGNWIKRTSSSDAGNEFVETRTIEYY